MRELSEKLLEAAKKAGLVLYKQELNEELALFRWWMHLIESDEMEKTFAPSARSVSGFYSVFESPSIMVYSLEGDDIWFAAWFHPIPDSSACYMGLWVRANRRMARKAWGITKAVYEAALNVWPIILGITLQEELLEPHKRIGYKILSELPKFYDGKSTWLVLLTAKGFAEGRFVKEKEE